MAIDYTTLLKKLNPDQDGQPPTHLRVGVVDAVNADGTLDIEMSGGVIVPDVPKLATAYAPAGAPVQMLAFRGSLLVLGAVGSSSLNGPMTKTGAVSAGPSAAILFTTAVSFAATFPGVPTVLINLNSAAGPTTGWHGRAYDITTTGFTLVGFGPSATFTSSWQWAAMYAP